MVSETGGRIVGGKAFKVQGSLTGMPLNDFPIVVPHLRFGQVA